MRAINLRPSFHGAINRWLLFGLLAILAATISMRFLYPHRSRTPYGHLQIKLRGLDGHIPSTIIEDPPTISIASSGDYLLQSKIIPKAEFESTIYKITMLQPIDERGYLIHADSNVTFQTFANLLDTLALVSSRVMQDSGTKYGKPGKPITTVIRFPSVPSLPQQ